VPVGPPYRTSGAQQILVAGNQEGHPGRPGADAALAAAGAAPVCGVVQCETRGDWPHHDTSNARPF